MIASEECRMALKALLSVVVATGVTAAVYTLCAVLRHARKEE
jgi:hypothetical protein